MQRCLLGAAASRLFPGAVPGTLPCRDKEQAEIVAFMRARLTAGSGGSLCICGAPGVGKSATIAHVLARLAALAAECGSLTPTVHVSNALSGTDGVPSVARFLRPTDGASSLSSSAADLRSATPAASSMAGVKRSRKAAAATPEEQEARALARTVAAFQPGQASAAVASGKRGKGGSQRRMHLVVVDEIDGLLTSSGADGARLLEALLGLPHAPATGHVIVIGLSNVISLPERLSPALRSPGRAPVTLVFAPYSAEDIQRILAARLEDGACACVGGGRGGLCVASVPLTPAGSRSDRRRSCCALAVRCWWGSRVTAAAAADRHRAQGPPLPRHAGRVAHGRRAAG